MIINCKEDLEKLGYDINILSDYGWRSMSRHYKLSESFIREFKDYVNWYEISINQKLSESFIKEFKDYVDWYWISRYQNLSESFIEEFKDYVNWNSISRYQKLTKSFIKKFTKLGKITIYGQYQIQNSWLYKTTEFKKQEVINTELYECFDDHFIAYKGVRSNNYSVFSFQYQYFVGNTYESNVDHSDNENSYGLSVWNLKGARDYCDQKIIKVKVMYKDVARVVHNGGKIRCCKFEVLEEVSEQIIKKEYNWGGIILI